MTKLLRRYNKAIRGINLLKAEEGDNDFFAELTDDIEPTLERVLSIEEFHENYKTKYSTGKLEDHIFKLWHGDTILLTQVEDLLRKYGDVRVADNVGTLKEKIEDIIKKTQRA